MSSYAAFVSYSREDSEFALRLAQDLKKAGAHIWLDQMDIRPGSHWDNEIEKALTDSPLMLLILSPSSARSENVRDEISFALEEKKTVIPVLYMSCMVPLRLQRAQRIDFRSDYDRGLTSLLQQLEVARPDPSLIETVVEGDAQWEAEWQARELQAQKLTERVRSQEASGPGSLPASYAPPAVAKAQQMIPPAAKPAAASSDRSFQLYKVSRNGQTYGPYTFEDLQRFIAGGNVLLTDLAKSAEMMEWIPVSQLLADPPPASAGGPQQTTVVPQALPSIAAPLRATAQVMPDREALKKRVRLYQIASIALFALWMLGSIAGLDGFNVISFLLMIVAIVQFVRVRRKLNATQV